MSADFGLLLNWLDGCRDGAKRGQPMYALATISDWLQGPYVYALYEQYGYNASQISFLLCAVALFRALCFGTVKGTLNHYATKYFVMPGNSRCWSVLPPRRRPRRRTNKQDSAKGRRRNGATCCAAGCGRYTPSRPRRRERPSGGVRGVSR